MRARDVAALTVGVAIGDASMPGTYERPFNGGQHSDPLLSSAHRSAEIDHVRMFDTGLTEREAHALHYDDVYGLIYHLPLDGMIPILYQPRVERLPRALIGVPQQPADCFLGACVVGEVGIATRTVDMPWSLSVRRRAGLTHFALLTPHTAVCICAAPKRGCTARCRQRRQHTAV